MAEQNDDYDSPWKDAIDHYFPEAYVRIDWSKEQVFLDQELHAVVQDAELGKRLVDKLVRVTLQNGDENWIYIHVEVQGTKQVEFAERMFVYNYRLYDRYRRPIASMAVLTDEVARWRPNSYSFEALGCEHTLLFRTTKLTDYRNKMDELLVSNNAFALITAAHILTQQTRRKDQERYEAKLRLVRILYQRRWDKQRIINLFVVLDWMMKLPEWLDQQVWHEIEKIEENEKMQYITSVEKIGIAKGRLEGRKEGESKLLRKLLERRFGALPTWVSDKLNSAGEQDLETWGEAVLVASTLEPVQDLTLGVSYKYLKNE